MKITEKEFTKEINFEPGYDYIVGVPKKKKGYGRHGMQFRFVLIGPKGAVSFLMFADWLPMIKDKVGMWKPTFISPFGRDGMWPMAADIGYHSPKPMYKGQTKRKCDYTESGSCYYDGSGLYAEEFKVEFINKGEDALWSKMKEYYKETFSKKGSSILNFGEMIEIIIRKIGYQKHAKKQTR